MQKSIVKWFDAKKGYGFINHPSGGDDVFVHYSQIISTKDFKTLRTGQEVRFDLNDGPKGLHALDVKPLAEEEGEGTKKANTDDTDRSNASASAPEPVASETPTPEASTPEASTPATPSASETSSPEATDESSDDDEWEWDENWTDEHGNPPDPMASPSF